MKILQANLLFIPQNYFSEECTRVGKMKAIQRLKTLSCAADSMADR